MDVRVPTDEFRSRGLPSVCVKSGRPADTWHECAFKSRIGAQWLLLLLGVLPFVFVRVLTTKRAVGYLPVNREAARDLVALAETRRRTVVLRSLAVGAGVGLVGAVIGIAIAAQDFNTTNSKLWAALIPLGASTIVGLVVGAVLRAGISIAPAGYLDRSGERLILIDVAEQFGAAVR